MNIWFPSGFACWLIWAVLVVPCAVADKPTNANNNQETKQTGTKDRQEKEPVANKDRKRQSRATKTRKRRASKRTRSRKDAQEQQTVDTEEVKLFEAMKNNQIDVLVVAHNFSLLTVSLRNRTATPLLVRAPEVFAAIPAQRILARQAARQFGNRNTRNRHVTQSSQGLGGSFYRPEAGQRLARRYKSDEPSLADEKTPMVSTDDLASWLLQPGQVVTQPVPCFCLEFGKPDPSRRVRYLLRPLTDLTKDRAVHELLVLFGKRRCTQRVAQIAAWHVTNKVPWQMLAQVTLPRSIAGNRQKFSLRELQAAKMLSESLPAYQERFRNAFNPGR